jgi:hypothetical protein
MIRDEGGGTKIGHAPLPLPLIPKNKKLKAKKKLFIFSLLALSNTIFYPSTLTGSPQILLKIEILKFYNVSHPLNPKVENMPPF